MLKFIPTDLSLTTVLYACDMTQSLKNRVCSAVCITTYELVTCVTIKIKLRGFGTIHNQLSREISGVHYFLSLTTLPGLV